MTHPNRRRHKADTRPKGRERRKGERRVDYPADEQKLYSLPNLPEAMQAERRQDELDRMYEVYQQKRLWWLVIGLCLLMNIFIWLMPWLGKGWLNAQ